MVDFTSKASLNTALATVSDTQIDGVVIVQGEVKASASRAGEDIAQAVGFERNADQRKISRRFGNRPPRLTLS